MNKTSTSYAIIVFVALFFPLMIQAQSDCSTAVPVCDDSDIIMDPSGIGAVDDFASGANSSGCLSSGEDNSYWMEITFNASTPANLMLEFTATTQGAGTVDTDFAMWGPNPDCDNLGGPIRCNFSSSDIAGLGSGDAGYDTPLAVNSCETYLILINDFSTDGGPMILTWNTPNVGDYFTCHTAGSDITVCEGETFILSDAAYSGGAGTETYEWTISPPNPGIIFSPSNTVLNPTVTLPAGQAINATFTLTVTENGCVVSDDITVSTYLPPTPTGGNDSFCAGQSVTLDPGFFAGGYQWSTGDASQTISVNTAGTYTVTVTDGNNCTGEASFVVTEASALNIQITGGPEFCPGGFVTITATAGYTYEWSTTETTQSIDVSAAGTYSVTATATDGTGCTGTASIVISEGAGQNVNITQIGVLCNNNGAAQLDAGLGAGFSYNWLPNGENTQIITATDAITYMVTATDNVSSCTFEGSYTVALEPPLIPQIDGTLEFCTGLSTTLSVSGGTFVAPYNWTSGSGNSTNPTIGVSSPGLVAVTVTDANGCTGETTTNVIENPLPSTVVTGDLTVCAAGNTTTTLDAGAGFSYNWSAPGGSNQTLLVSQPGTYTVTITDGNGCENQAAATVVLAAAPTTTITGDLTICAAGNTTTTLNAGPGFSYDWSAPGGSNQTLDISQTGTYTVTITDGNGCEGESSATVISSAPPTPVITGNLFICATGNTMTTLDAGDGFNSYSWSPTNDNTQTTVATATGNYTVTVTDAEGCEGEQTVAVDLYNTTDPIITGDNLICPGETTDLTATGNFTGGYVWSAPPGGTTPLVTVPGAGTYTVTATDDNGCETTDDFVINLAPVPMPQIDPQNPAICAAGNTTVLLDAGDFPAGYTYSWALPSGETTQTIIANTLGDCSVTVTSDEGCEGVDIVEIIEAPTPAPIIDGNANICEGTSTTLSVTSGFETYTWSDGSTLTSIEADMPGTYTITVTNQAGCEGAADLLVVSAPSPVVIITGEDFCEGGNTLLEASATGGSTFTYLWDNGLTTQFNSVLETGTYLVTVTNEFDCEGEGSIDVEELTIEAPEITGDLTICEGEQTTLTLEAYGTYDEVTWSDGSTGETITVTTSGTITVNVVDNNCPAEAEVTVTVIAIDDLIITGETEICDGATIILVANGDFDAATLVWSDGTSNVGTGQTLDITEAGTYTVTGQNAGGCTATSEEFIVVEQTTIIEITGDFAFCEGESTQLTVTPGFETYTWTYTDANGDAQEETFNTNTITATTVGLCTVVATTSAGCSGIDSIVLVVNLNPIVNIEGSTTFCTGSETPLTANVEFGPNDYTYEWSGAGNGTTQSITATAAGTYIVQVTDGNGCTALTEIAITEQNELSPVISGDLAFCENGNTTLSVGDNYQTQTWSTGETTTSIEITTGQEEVTVFVTDAFGCSGEASVEVIENTLPTVSIIGDEYFCENNTASVTVNETFVSYIWSNGDTGNSATVLAGGIIEVTVTDDNTCENQAAVSVEMLPLPIPQIDGGMNFCPDTETTLFGEVGFDSYTWSGDGVGAAADLLVTAPGNYILSVEDEFGCIGSDSTIVANFEVEAPQIIGTLAFCPGDTVSLQANNTNAGYSYAWSTGSFGDEINIADADNYIVTATDANDCITISEEEATHFTVLDPVITGDNEFCTGENIDLDAGLFVSYAWSDDNNSTSQNINITEGGQFDVDVIDMNGCESSGSYIVIEHALPEVEIGGSSSYCIGSFTTLNAGATYSSYSWSTGSAESSIEVSSIGTISVSVEDEYGCPGDDTVEIQEDTELNPAVTGDTDFCIGDTTFLDAGTFEVYQWTDELGVILATTRILAVDEPGDYNLYVEDASGCIGNAVTPVVQNELPTPQITGEFEFCAGLSTTLDAGEDFTIEEWSTGSLNNIITVDSAGLYVVQVSNEFGCIQSTSVEVMERALPVFAIEGIDFFCENESTSVEVSNPLATDTYLWTNGDDENTTTVSAAGEIGVMVTNEFGCVHTEQILINEIELPIAVAGDDQNLDCEVLFTNIGNATSSFGDEFTYLWTGPGIDTANESMLQPEVGEDGMYTLIITDTVHHCISEASITEIVDLAYVPEVALNVDGVIDCVTDEVMIDASNSTSGQNIQYSWFREGNIIAGIVGTNLPVSDAGSYSLEVMDTETHCMNEASVLVEENVEQPSANAGITPGTLTCEVLELTLDASASETGANITYEWSGSIISGNTTLSPTVGEPGLYILTVTNEENSCINTASVSVPQNIVNPIAEAGGTQEIDCHSETVTIDGTGTSSTSNFIYNWTFNGEDISAENLVFDVEEPGTYQIFVQNLINGCTSSDNVIITIDENTPSAFTYAPSSPTCEGDDNGSIEITEVMGGLAPILYSINGAPFTASTTFSNLNGGEYAIVIQDVEGCEYDEIITLEDGNDLSLDLGDDIYINLGETADVEATVNLDESEIASIVWQTVDSLDCVNTCLTFTTQPYITTMYEVTVVDENNCIRTDDLTVFVNKPRDVFVPNAFSPNGDGNNDILQVFSGADIKIVHSFLIFNRWGEPVFQVYNFPTNDPAYGWNGKENGRVFNSQVFTYFAQVEFIDGEIVLFKGDVILMK